MNKIDIRPFDMAGATDGEYEAVNRLLNRSRAETLPDDPPIPVQETKASMQNIPPYDIVKSWSGWETGTEQVTSRIAVWFTDTNENTHAIQFALYVDPAYRRRGIARELLKKAVDMARLHNRRLMITSTSDRAPAGVFFMERLKAERGLEESESQLSLAELDMSLIDRWQTDGRRRAAEFSLRFWDGRYPEEQLEAICELLNVMNSAPLDKLAIEDINITPRQARQDEESLFAVGIQRWTAYTIEDSTGEFAGYTEVFWNPNRPWVVEQGATAVVPRFRGKGMGRWLKAAMLERILQIRPEARFVRTTSAYSNAAMLGINETIGFKHYDTRCVWQVETDKAAAYIERSGDSAFVTHRAY